MDWTNIMLFMFIPKNTTGKLTIFSRIKSDSHKYVGYTIYTNHANNTELLNLLGYLPHFIRINKIDEGKGILIYYIQKCWNKVAVV